MTEYQYECDLLIEPQAGDETIQGVTRIWWHSKLRTLPITLNGGVIEYTYYAADWPPEK